MSDAMPTPGVPTPGTPASGAPVPGPPAPSASAPMPGVPAPGSVPMPGTPAGSGAPLQGAPMGSPVPNAPMGAPMGVPPQGAPIPGVPPQGAPIPGTPTPGMPYGSPMNPYGGAPQQPGMAPMPHHPAAAATPSDTSLSFKALLNAPIALFKGMADDTFASVQNLKSYWWVSSIIFVFVPALALSVLFLFANQSLSALTSFGLLFHGLYDTATFGSWIASFLILTFFMCAFIASRALSVFLTARVAGKPMPYVDAVKIVNTAASPSLFIFPALFLLGLIGTYGALNFAVFLIGLYGGFSWLFAEFAIYEALRQYTRTAKNFILANTLFMMMHNFIVFVVGAVFSGLFLGASSVY